MDDLLTLTQWLSPAFPTGAFAWSSGLEQAVADGLTPDTLPDWLATYAEDGPLWSDLVILAHAARGEDVAELATALQVTAERRAETLEQGAAFARTIRAVWALDLPDAALPVVLGAAVHQRGLAITPTLQLYAQTVLSNLVQAALRLMPLGQTKGAQVLADLTARLPALCAQAAEATLDDIGTSALLHDTAAMRHETLEPRIFRS